MPHHVSAYTPRLPFPRSAVRQKPAFDQLPLDMLGCSLTGTVGFLIKQNKHISKDNEYAFELFSKLSKNRYLYN